MAIAVDDYVFKLGWDGDAVIDGIKAVEARINKLSGKTIGVAASGQRRQYSSPREQRAAFTPYNARAKQREATVALELESSRLSVINEVGDKMRRMESLGNNNNKLSAVLRSQLDQNIILLQNFNQKWGEGSVKSRAALATMRTELKQLTPQLKIVNEQVAQVTRKFGILQNITKRVGATFLAMGASTVGAYALADIGRQSFENAKGFEQMEIAMTAAFGSQQRADEEMAYAQDVAKRYALDLFSVGEGWSKISYAAKMSNMPMDQARQMFEDLAVSSRAFGLSADDTKGAMRAVIQMMGKGKVNAEDLRQQLAERIPAAIPMLAKSMGITVGELEDQMKKGAIPAEKLVGMFKMMAEDVKTSGALAKSMKSLGAAQTGLSNAYKKASNVFWGKDAKGGFKDFMFMLADFLERNQKAIGQWGDAFAISGQIVLDSLSALSPILSLVNTGFQSMFELLEGGNIDNTKFGTLNALGKTLAMIGWLIHDIKLAYEDLEKMLTGKEMVGGQAETEATIARAKARGVSVEDQMAWEIKYKKHLDAIEAQLQNKEITSPYVGEGIDMQYYRSEWIRKQAERRSMLEGALGGGNPDVVARNRAAGMMFGEKLANTLTQGTLEFKMDASNVINLNKDGTADVSIPYTFNLGFSDSGGKNRGQ